MSLEHRDPPRFTLDQRDEILNLAARLQIQHEATVGVDDLFAEAVAAGIDPRFVQDAAMRVGRKGRQKPRLAAPLLAFLLFVAQAGFLLGDSFGWFGHGNAILEWPEGVVAAETGLILALWAAREPLTRRFVPLATLAVWLAVGLLTLGTRRIVEGYFPSNVATTALVYGAIQFVAALLAVMAVREAERIPRNARSFRLYRGRRA